MFDFFGGGYYLDLSALHLTLAYIAAAILAAYVFAAKGSTLQKLVILYFSLTLFNNFAFQIGGAALGDLVGILTVLVFTLRAVAFGQYYRFFKTHRLAFGLLAVTFLIVMHQVIVGSLYSGLNEDGAWKTRVAVTLKIVVMAMVIWIFSREFRDTESVHRLMNWIVSFAMIGIAAYFIQGMILVTGRLPYGTFFDAGFVGIPTFGGVSIERGHFGKFLTPLYPVFLLMYIKHKRRLAWIGFVVVTLINISASSLVYFAAYIILTAIAFRSHLKRPRILARVIAGLTCFLAVSVAMHNVLMGVIDKVLNQGLKGDAEGGRGLANFFDYLHRYPLGMSYGGSSLRHISDLQQMNSGILSFITQLGIIAPILLLAYVWLLVSTYQRSKLIEDVLTRRLMVIGSMMTLLIFSADPLWFVPTIWLPIIICQTKCMTVERCPECDKATLLGKSNFLVHCLSLVASSANEELHP